MDEWFNKSTKEIGKFKNNLGIKKGLSIIPNSENK